MKIAPTLLLPQAASQTPAQPMSSSSLSNITKKGFSRMNLFTAINEGMRTAMETDPTAITFGEDVSVGFSTEKGAGD